MNIIADYKMNPLFEPMRKQILSMGVDDMFFDSEGFVGGYWLQQNSFEFASFIFYIRSLFPHGLYTFAEVGTAAGGFARAFSDLVGFKNYISVDLAEWRQEIWPINEKEIETKAEVHRFEGNSHGEQCEVWLDAKVKELKPIDFLFIDGDHSYEGVKADIELAKRVLPRGTLVGFHDIACGRTPGVTKAYRELKDVERLAEFIHPGESQMGIGVVRI